MYPRGQAVKSLELIKDDMGESLNFHRLNIKALANTLLVAFLGEPIYVPAREAFLVNSTLKCRKGRE